MMPKFHLQINNKKIPHPLIQKEVPTDAQRIDLIPPELFQNTSINFFTLLQNRISRRKYTEDPLTLEELSFLLWSTQGVRKATSSRVLRTVPSAGARCPFETYLIVNRVETLKPGIYRYLSLEHKLYFIKDIETYESLLSDMTYNQKFIGKSAVSFCWVTIPYRTEWRYSTVSHKFIAIDLGAVCENLYLACESRNLGTVAIGYYDQTRLDTLFDLDGEEEFLVLMVPVGNIPKK